MTLRAFLPVWLAASILVVAAIIAIAVGEAVVVLMVAVAVPLWLWISERPQRGLLLLVALAPFDGLRIIVPEISAAWKFALLGAIVVATFVCPRTARALAHRRVPALLVFVAAFLLIALLSAAAVGGEQALIGLKLNFVYLLAGFAVWRCPFDGRERDHFVTILMVTGFVCSVIGLAQQVIGTARLNAWGYPYNDTIRFNSGGSFRSFSTFDQPFPFGLFLAFVIVVGLAVALHDTRRFRNHLFLMLLPVYGAALLFSFVRSAFVALFIGALYLALRGRRIILAVLPLLVVAFLVAGSGAGSIASGSSLHARTSGWQANIDTVFAHPLGAGIGSTGSAAEKLVKLRKATHAYQPDNYFFKTLYELGPLGLWLLVLVLVAMFRTASGLARRLVGVDGALCEGLAAAVLGAAAASLFATYLEIFPLDLLFWLTLGLLARIAANVTDEGGDEAALAHEIRRPAHAVPHG